MAKWPSVRDPAVVVDHDELSRKIQSIPPFPAVAMNVLRIVRNVEFSMKDLVRIMETDLALTSIVLRLCNSSLFALPNPITSIEQALSFLGIRNIVRIVIASCASSYFSFPRTGDAYLDPKIVWRHSVACATTCRMLAETCHELDRGVAYTAGILHNIGKVVIAQLGPVVDAFVDDRPGDALTEIEREKYGCDHATIGGLVVGRWHISEQLANAILNHHDADRIRDDSVLTAIVHLADIACLRAGIGDTPRRGLSWEFYPVALERLEISHAQLDDVMADVLDDLARSEDLVNMI